MKVFILTTVMAPYRVQLFNEIGKKCELHVCFEQRRSEGRDETWYDEKMTSFRFVPLKRWDSPVSRIKPEIIRKLIEIKPDVAIAYEYSKVTAMLFMSCCMLMGIPYLINCDGGFITRSPKDIIKRFYISRAAGCISSGGMADQYLAHYGAKRARIFRNHFTSLYARDIRDTAPSEEERAAARRNKGIGEKRMVLAVGQFIRRKGFDILLRAAAEFDEETGVYFIGGEETEEYRNLIDQLALKNIHFLNFMSPDELREYFAAADVFVMPTREDVWGLVINEAMASGLPIVSTDKCIAGLEMIEEGENGFVVRAEEAEALGAAVNRILKDPQLRNQMARKSLQRVRTYTYEQSAEEIGSAIAEVYHLERR